MSASRSLYIEIAKYINYHRQVDDILSTSDFVVALSHILQADNSAFDKDRFFRACGFPELADN